MLTPICRPAIEGPTPLALVDATTQGSGKTLLTEIASLIATGRAGALFTAPREPEEWRKQLTAILREGSTMVVIDNVKYRLDSAELCKALTAENYGDRILGQSSTVTLPVRCAWVTNGNNIQLGGDMPKAMLLDSHRSANIEAVSEDGLSSQTPEKVRRAAPR
jgi:hypothetical protein